MAMLQQGSAELASAPNPAPLYNDRSGYRLRAEYGNLVDMLEWVHQV